MRVTILLIECLIEALVTVSLFILKKIDKAVCDTFECIDG